MACSDFFSTLLANTPFWPNKGPPPRALASLPGCLSSFDTEGRGLDTLADPFPFPPLPAFVLLPPVHPLLGKESLVPGSPSCIGFFPFGTSYRPPAGAVSSRPGRPVSPGCKAVPEVAPSGNSSDEGGMGLPGSLSSL